MLSLNRKSILMFGLLNQVRTAIVDVASKWLTNYPKYASLFTIIRVVTITELR